MLKKETMRRKSISRSIAAIGSFVILASCVNQDYDLTKINIDTLSGLKGVEVPVGSTERFVLKDLLPENLGELAMSVDQDGNLMLSIGGHVGSDEISVPEFTLEGYYDHTTESSVVQEPIYISGLAQNPGLQFPPIPFKDIVYNIDIHQKDLPKEVIDVRYADVTSVFSIAFNYNSSKFPFEKFWISSGSAVHFPEGVILDDVPAGFVRVSDHEIAFKDDFPILPSGSSVRFPIKGMDFTKLPEGQGFISAGEFRTNFDVVVSGSLFVRAQDCKGEGVFQPEFESVIALEEAVINSITASVEIDDDMNSFAQEFMIKDVPDYLKSDATCLDFNALRLNITVDNGLPFNGLLNASFASYLQGDHQQLWESQIDGLILPSSSSVSYSLSEDGAGAPEGYENVAVSGLNSFLRRMPDSYTVKCDVAAQDEYIDIVPGAKYGMSLDYEFLAPLSFGPDFRLQITEDFKNLNVNVQEVDVASAIVRLDAVNALPLAFMLEAQALDKDGNVIEEITASLDKEIAAGSLASPSVNPVQITLAAQGKLSFDGIRLTVIADSPAEGPLNDNQYFMFDNISLHLPEGITYRN